MGFVVKVEFEGILRPLPYSFEGTEKLSLAKLEGRVRDLLKLPSAAKLKITYKDEDDDDVTLTNDLELNDACVIQKLNPLRLQVVVSPPNTSEDEVTTAEALAAPAAPAAQPSSHELEFVEKPTIHEAYVKKIVECYAPVFEGICPPSQIPDVMDDIVKKVTAKVSDVILTQSVQTTDSGNPSPETREVTPLDWLRNLPNPKVSTGTEEQDKNKTSVETPVEISPLSSSAKSTKEDEKVVHKGVTCDVCQMSPITGIRYKAIKKMNYDLCGRCFDRSGKADEYNRIERPLSRPVWPMDSVRMVRLSPAIAMGPTDSCPSPKPVRLVLAPRGVCCKPVKSC